MFESVAGAVSSANVAEALRVLDSLTARVAAIVGAFDRSGEWALDGATSVQAWLRDHGLAAGDAARLARTGRGLARLPVLSDAWQRGDLSSGQVQAVLAHVTSRHVGLFALHEADVVPALVGLSVVDTATAMAEWSARADALDDGSPAAADDEPARTLRLSKTLDDRFVLNASLDAEGGAVLSRALELADSGDFAVPVPQRRADALVDIARHFLDNQQHRRGGRNRPHLNVVVDAGEPLGRGGLVDAAVPVGAATVSRLLCDCALNRVVVERLDGGRSAILDYGTSVRTIPAPLWSALVVRDRHCRFPGCDRPPSWCEGHHVRWFQHGGPTALDNLVLLCTRHHHLLHSSRGFEAKLLPDATFEVTLPTGVVRSTHPPPRALFDRAATTRCSSPPDTIRRR